jgi:hypothetical protein
MENGMNGADTNVFAMDVAKSKYLEACSKMTWDQLFAELMRVHTESAKLLNTAYKELERLNEIVNADEYDGDARH